CQQFNVNPTF
nr:immunoglobulin light chain junction region [Macaca mulatta]